MLLYLAVGRRALEKARNTGKLIRKIVTATRDGTTYQQAFWVRPEDMMADKPVRAQLDLFDQAPPEPKKEPGIFEFPAYVQVEEKPDKTTREGRALAAELADYLETFPDQQSFTQKTRERDHAFQPWDEQILEMVNSPRNAYEKAFIAWGGKGIRFQTDLGQHFLTRPWNNWPVYYRMIARGEIGLDILSPLVPGVSREYYDADQKPKRIKAKWESMSPDDFARFYLAALIANRASAARQKKLFDRAKAEGRNYYNDEERWADPEQILFRDIEAQKHCPLFHHSIWYDDKKIKDIIEGKTGATYKLGKKTMILKPLDVEAAPLSTIINAGDPVEAVKKLVARGVKTYRDCLQVGEIIYDVVLAKNEEIKEKIKEYDTKMNKIRADIKATDLAKANKEHEKLLAYKVVRSMLPGDSKASAEWDILADEFDKEISNLSRELSKLWSNREAIIKESSALWNSVKKENSEKILGFMGKIRPMGIGDKEPPYYESTNGTNKANPEKIEAVRKIMPIFPRAWIEKVPKLVLVVGSGSCAGYRVKAQWKANMGPSELNTQAHELGHAMETAARLGDLCCQFMYSLVDDENDGRVKTKAGTMRNWQKGLESSHLPHQYCGVLYPSGATELVSMAAGAFYNDYDGCLSRGKKYWQFIFGLWAGV